MFVVATVLRHHRQAILGMDTEGLGRGGRVKGRASKKCPFQDHPLCSARELTKILTEKVCAGFSSHFKGFPYSIYGISVHVFG